MDYPWLRIGYHERVPPKSERNQQIPPQVGADKGGLAKSRRPPGYWSSAKEKRRIKGSQAGRQFLFQRGRWPGFAGIRNVIERIRSRSWMILFVRED
jgi:hypothetical protein